MIYIVVGNEEFLIKEKAKSIILDTEIIDNLNVDRIDAEKLKFHELLSNLNTLSLFNEQKISVVENFFSNFNKKNKKDDLKKFYDQLLEIPSNSIVIFTEYPKENKRSYIADYLTPSNQIFKLIAHNEKIKFFELNKLKNFGNNNEVERWFQEKCKNSSIKIENQAIKELVSLKGNNLRSLSNEINKLHSFSKGSTITMKHVKELTNEWKEYNIFPIIDSIVNGKGRQTEKEMNAMILKGDISRQEIFYRIARQTSVFIKVAECKSLPKSQISEKVGIHGYRLQKIMDQIQYDMEYYKRNLETIKSYDMKLKSGVINEQIALDLLINDLN
ncbi:MAG: DNA polymerase III subunit delta [Dehalococcoidia bacterium]|nr:DNA polymerase III subunit delta [Dehalococcoidia bacterium]